jgi:murein DD-endopeptidase MepM/ murein hydrolase activator NlpD
MPLQHVRQQPDRLLIDVGEMDRRGQQVAAGDQLAEVGNAGPGSEPHLRFAAFELDASGRPQAIPLTFTGLNIMSQDEGISFSLGPKTPKGYFLSVNQKQYLAKDFPLEFRIM